MCFFVEKRLYLSYLQMKLWDLDKTWALYILKLVPNTFGSELMVRLFWFYGISTFVGYLSSNPFLYK